MARSKSSPHRDDPAAVTDALAAAATRWLPGTRVCVALSGGSDSIVLLHALAALRVDTWRLAAHHVHHGLSPNADAWVAHCQAACTELSVPLSIDRVFVDQRAGSGVESAARDARLASLNAVDADIIVLAHHALDQAETLLLQLLRGSGPAGMAAMPVVAGRLMRPLLGVSKASLTSYAAQHHLLWVDDESNNDNRFSRNRLRHTVWPALIQAFPAAETTLCRAARLQADASLLLDELAAIDAATCVVDTALDLLAFNALSQPRRANLLRYWLLANDVGPLAAETLREWLKQLAGTATLQAIELRGGQHNGAVRVFRGRAYVAVDVRRWLPQAWNGENVLPVRSAAEVAGTVEFLPVVADNGSFAFRGPLGSESWLLRSRQDGDGVELSARSGHVSLKNLFQHAGIPPWLRSTWPLVTCDDEIVAVASVATAKAFTVAPGERGFVCQWKPAWGLPPRS